MRCEVKKWVNNDGMSCVNTKAIREGYVYKNLETGESFKVIGAGYLLKKG